MQRCRSSRYKARGLDSRYTPSSTLLHLPSKPQVRGFDLWIFEDLPHEGPNLQEDSILSSTTRRRQTIEDLDAWHDDDLERETA